MKERTAAGKKWLLPYNAAHYNGDGWGFRGRCANGRCDHAPAEFEIQGGPNSYRQFCEECGERYNPECYEELVRRRSGSKITAKEAQK